MVVGRSERFRTQCSVGSRNFDTLAFEQEPHAADPWDGSGGEDDLGDSQDLFLAADFDECRAEVDDGGVALEVCGAEIGLGSDGRPDPGSKLRLCRTGEEYVERPGQVGAAGATNHLDEMLGLHEEDRDVRLRYGRTDRGPPSLGATPKSTTPPGVVIGS